MKIFDIDSFLNVAITALQAEEIAFIADSVLQKNSFVLYGRYKDGKYFNYSSVQDSTDTHVLFAFAPKKLKRA